MLRTTVVDLVNSGTAWAFLGAGVTADAGGATWSKLLDHTISALGLQEILERDTRFGEALRRSQYARCFSRVESHSDRTQLEAAVAECMGQTTNPGTLHSLLADWPFRGYITTNYDLLLEEALRRKGERGWIPIGNSRSETRKVAGNPENVVWHIHGFVDTEGDYEKSRLVLTEEDYDDLYLDEGPVITQLKGLLSHARILFVGLGFSDPEFDRVLKRVGKLTSPERPLQAFFPYRPNEFSHDVREEYLLQYNIDLIPYEIVGDSHKALGELLKTYGAFCVRRSIAFGRTRRHPPSFDPETTGLLVYNELCLRGQAHPSRETQDALLRARVLSALKPSETHSSYELAQEIHPRIALLDS